MDDGDGWDDNDNALMDLSDSARRQKQLRLTVELFLCTGGLIQDGRCN